MMHNNSLVQPSNLAHPITIHPTPFVDADFALFDNFDGNTPHSPIDCGQGELIHHQLLCICVQRGQMKLFVNGQPLVMESNHIYYIAAHSIIRVDSASDDFKYFLYSVSNSFLREVYAEMGLVFKMPSRYKRFSQKSLTEEEMNHRLTLYNDQQRDLRQTSDTYRKTIAQTYLCVLCAYDIDLLEPELQERDNSVSKQKTLFRNFVDLLNEHTQRQREVQFYARQLGITPKYLSALCIEYSGRNASAWIDDYVMARIKNLMQEHRYSIKEIAQLMNFPTQSFFGRYFKRIEGVSPRKYLVNQDYQ